MKLVSSILITVVVSNLAYAKNDLKSVATMQQQAIKEFIGAMKHIKKAHTKNGKATKKSMFKDKQDFEIPKFVLKENLEYKLEKVRESQQNIINELELKKKNYSLKDIQKKQEDTSKNAQEIHDSVDDKKQQKSLNNIVKSGSQAAMAMASNENKIALQKAQQAKNQLSAMLRELAIKSTAKQQQILNKLQKDINELDKKQLSDQELQQKIRELADDLKEKAKDQYKNGKRKHGDQLADLAQDMATKSKNMGSGSESSGIENNSPLKELGMRVSEIREENKGTVPQLIDGMSKLKKYQKKLKFAEKHPDSFDEKEKKEFAKNIELTMQDVARIVEKLQKKTDEKVHNKEPNKNKKMGNLMSGGNFNYSDFIEGSYVKQLDNRFRYLITQASNVLDSIEKNNKIYHFKKDDIPEKYQQEVADYFEALSLLKNKTKHRGK